MKIVIEYIGMDRTSAAQILKKLTEAAEEAAEEHPDLGFPDSVHIER